MSALHNRTYTRIASLGYFSDLRGNTLLVTQVAWKSCEGRSGNREYPIVSEKAELHTH